MFDDYWMKAKQKTKQEKATTRMIIWMEQEWLRVIKNYSYDAIDRIEALGDNAYRDIIATRYWDGRRRCKECGTLVDRWFTGKLCRTCYFKKH